MDVLPQHVAIIMDGNRRWAAQKKLSRLAGHRAGVESLRQAIQFAAKNEIKILSVFAFSTENWQRPKEEVTGLMTLFLSALRNEVNKLHENNIQLKVIGDITHFSKKIQEHIIKAQVLTAENTGMKLVIAANYGGRWDIVSSVKQLVMRVASGDMTIEQIDEEAIAQGLSLADWSDPDLFIRTSGELRISNFFLWQLAYTEFYFTDTFWPEFNENEFQKALAAYAARVRRFGGK